MEPCRNFPLASVPAWDIYFKEVGDWIEMSTKKFLEIYFFLLGALDAWLNTATRVGEDLTFLLRLPAHKFWSQILFDERLQVILNFFI